MWPMTATGTSFGTKYGGFGFWAEKYWNRWPLGAEHDRNTEYPCSIKKEKEKEKNKPAWNERIKWLEILVQVERRSSMVE